MFVKLKPTVWLGFGLRITEDAEYKGIKGGYKVPRECSTPSEDELQPSWLPMTTRQSTKMISHISCTNNFVFNTIFLLIVFRFVFWFRTTSMYEPGRDKLRGWLATQIFLFWVDYGDIVVLIIDISSNRFGPTGLDAENRIVEIPRG